MSSGDRPSQRWHDAAQAASFRPYELVIPALRMARAGGFGWGSDGVDLLQLGFVADHSRVIVSTERDRTDDEVRLRRLVYEHLRRVVARDLILPMTIELLRGDCTFVVDGVDRLFSGVATPGLDRWAGLCRIDDVAITVVIEGAQPEHVVLAGCTSTDEVIDGPFD